MISLLNNLRGLEGPTKLFSLNNSFCGGIDLQQSPYQQPTTSIVGKSHYFIKTLFMQPKLLGFRVSQHQQTRFSDITEEIEIATMFKDLTSWYCNFLSISDEIFNPFFENMYRIKYSLILYKNIGSKVFVLLCFQNHWPLF